MSARALAPRAPASGVMVSATPRHPKMIAADAVDALHRVESELLIFQTATESDTFRDLAPVVVSEMVLEILRRVAAVRESLEEVTA